ncbi:HAUS augmin-like complex subunit 8 isoform X2 [Scyliorhinus canicula]|uniref:HAUS augmin-like complex subunit 8 isoform X2 n=1 Tax=Scyliorhinus canicula TaxID=7830 RepID=UPI0018F29B1F|nr:HAUS augmin-like complex subunit 8 isoform X2 [Scyliorhinus canicula]
MESALTDEISSVVASQRQSSRPSKRSANLIASKVLRSETESKSSCNTSVQSSQQKSMHGHVAKEQLFIKPTTPNLKRTDSFGSRKSFTEDSNGSSTLLKSSKSVPNLSDSRNVFTTQKSPLPTTPYLRPASTHTPKHRLSQCDTFQRITPKPRAASQSTSLKNVHKEESKVLDIGSSMEEHSGKAKGARAVQSRFREAAAMKKKVVVKDHEKSSGSGLKRLNVKKKFSDLHSTVLEESALLPSLNWDLSVMKQLSSIGMPEHTYSVLEPALSPTLPEEDATEVNNFDALLYSYMYSMRENKLATYQEKAEEYLLPMEENNEHFRRGLFQQKQELILQEKNKQMDGMVEQQLEHLQPVVASNQQFEIQYRTFGQALDTTRHGLQMKNISTSEDLRQNLEELKIHLKSTHQLLDGLGLQSDGSNSKAESELREAAAKTETEMKSFFVKIEEVASYISRETALIHQELDEEDLGINVSAKGIFI